MTFIVDNLMVSLPSHPVLELKNQLTYQLLNDGSRFTLLVNQLKAEGQAQAVSSFEEYSGNLVKGFVKDYSSEKANAFYDLVLKLLGLDYAKNDGIDENVHLLF